MLHTRRMRQIEIGERAPVVDATTLAGEKVTIPARDGRLVHLQFRRFAGCPVCNLHARAIATRIDDITRAGVREVALFHSKAATMRAYQGGLPFDVIADPERRFYDAYGVGTSMRSVLDPRTWGAMVIGMVASRSNAMVGEGGHLGLPAEFLLSDDGVVLAAHYGVHADDQWSVEHLLALAARARQPSHSTR